LWGELGLNVVGGILAGLAFSAWAWFRRKLIGCRFKKVFGPGVASDQYALIYAELELSDSSRAYPYVKPGGDRRGGFSISRPVSVCEVRALSYLASAIGRYVRASVAVRSDLETRTVLDLDFVSFGGPRSNFKTADCQSNTANQLAVFDQSRDQFVSRSSGSSMVSYEAEFDYGLILKVKPSQFPHRVWISCAGRGEWGTSGAAWFLANKWKEILRRAGSRPFAAIVRVKVPLGQGQDQSAEIINFLVGED
jgi:hypothetical protein